MIGKVERGEIAQRLGVSISNLKRSLRGESLWFHNGKYKNRPQLVRQVLTYYAKYGKKKTVERFPDTNVKCIIDRPEYYGFEKPKRQIRWTDEQIIEAARMAGLVSPKAQAKYFNRPRAHAGAIKSLWMKRFGYGQGNINGLVHSFARHLVGPKARYVLPLGEARDGRPIQFRRLCLWVDMERHLKPGVPEFMAEAVCSLAKFQRWLHGDENPRPKILKMIRERELT